MYRSEIAIGFRKRRQAKKHLNAFGPGTYALMERASHLRPGDLIHGCNGFNDVIVSVEPEYRVATRGKLVAMDYDIVAENGAHSLRHCCDLDLWTRDEVLRYFASWAADGGAAARAYNMLDVEKVALMVKEGRGEELFTERGTPTPLCVQIRREAQAARGER